jgi:DNA polymerase-3 subunit delta'
MSFEKILGQGQAIEIITRGLKNKSTSHAYLFYGPESIGKDMAAIAFAKALNCDESISGEFCDNCPACTKIDKRIHPDFFHIEPTKSSATAREGVIKVEEIRELQKKMSFLPYEGKTKVAIIDTAEQMNPQAANSFLKTLEEPPSSTVIILVAHNPFKLFPTIISRCQGVRFNPLSISAVRQIINKKVQEGEIPSEEAELRIIRSRGQISRALEENVAEEALQREDLSQLLNKVSFDRMDLIFNWSKACAANAGQITMILDELAGLLRDTAFIKSGSQAENIQNKDLIPNLIPLANKKSLSSLLKMHDSVHETKFALQGNANKQLSLENMLLTFCDIA